MSIEVACLPVVSLMCGRAHRMASISFASSQQAFAPGWILRCGWVAAESKADIDWVVSELEKLCKLQAEGPFPVKGLGSGEELNHLKKVHVFKEDGIYVKPNTTFTETLVQLYNLQEKKEKQVPEHSSLAQPDSSAELDEQRQSAFNVHDS